MFVVISRQSNAGCQERNFMKKKNLSKKVRTVRELFSDRTTVSDFWNPVWDGVIAGIAFDQKGMHVTTAWPDGEPIHWLVRWSDVSPNDLIRNSSLFQWVYDFCIVDDESVKLTPRQQNRKRAMVKAIFGLPEEFPVRVEVSTNAPEATTDGRKRSVEAATRGFEKKLGWIRRLHRKACRRIAAGTEESVLNRSNVE
jgi:hypothetical protein